MFKKKSQKDHWWVYDPEADATRRYGAGIYSHKSRHYSIKPKKSFWRASSRLGGLAKGGLTVLISVLVIYGVVQAGSLTPSASPAATSYTLSDIYTRLTTNATSTVGDHIFSPSASPAGTLYTLTQIYDAIPTIVASTVKLNTSYLGVTGTLTPDGGTAAVADLFNGKTANLTSDWTLDTGTLNLACNTATFDGTGNLVADAYDGTGTGLNRWCITDSGDAAAGDILSGKIAWVDGVATTGTIPTQTLSAASETVSAGYYAATTLSAVDVDLVAGNILSGKTIFGIAGTVSAGYTYGDNIQSTVLTTAAGPGTYNASNLSVGAVKSGTTFATSSTGAYPSATYTLASADATADLAASGGNISSSNGAVEWWQSDGTRQTATLDFPTLSNLCSTDTSNNSAGTLSLTAAYFSVGNTWCGTAGTLLANLFNGTSGAFPGGSQANGGADDWNAGDTAASGRYAMGWTACNAGNSYCGTSDTGADAKDDSTGLIWSMPCNGSGCASFSDAAPATYSWDSSAVNNNARTASQLCSDHTGWFLPHQKQLMQAYIDGSYGNLEALSNNRNYWSASTLSSDTAYAWYTYLTYGITSYNLKTVSSYSVRCVRSAS